MGREDAERAFGHSARFARSESSAAPHELRARLQSLLIDHKTMLDVGLEATLSTTLEATLRLRETTAARIAAARAAPALNGGLCDPLPPCDRWGDVYGAHVPASTRMRLCDMLAHESRASLPTATRACAASDRVGPGGTMRAELDSAWTPVEPYAALVKSRSLALSGGPLNDGPADAIALQQDGDRMWPPRALASPESARRVAALVERMCDAIEGAPERTRTTNGAGVYVNATRSVLEKVPGGDLDLSDMGRRELLGMGVGVFLRNPLALKSARKHVLHGAMAAHVRERAELGNQLERLGAAILTLGR